jgi:hypothetical protein
MKERKKTCHDSGHNEISNRLAKQERHCGGASVNQEDGKFTTKPIKRK